jgi:hypothetical protein
MFELIAPEPAANPAPPTRAQIALEEARASFKRIAAGGLP